MRSNLSPDEGLHLYLQMKVSTKISLWLCVYAQTSLCLLRSRFNQAHQQASMSWSKSPSATTSPSPLQAMDTAAGICPTCPAVRASYSGLPLEPPKSFHIPGATKPSRDACRKVPDPQENTRWISPASLPAQPGTHRLLPSPPMLCLSAQRYL